MAEGIQWVYYVLLKFVFLAAFSFIFDFAFHLVKPLSHSRLLSKFSFIDMAIFCAIFEGNQSNSFVIWPKDDVYFYAFFYLCVFFGWLVCVFVTNLSMYHFSLVWLLQTLPKTILSYFIRFHELA